jgi:hypothetical protein
MDREEQIRQAYNKFLKSLSTNINNTVILDNIEELENIVEDILLDLRSS